MSAHPIDLTYRLGVSFNARELRNLIELIQKEMEFDEETRYDLILEDYGGQRAEHEIQSPALGQFLTPEAWPDLHQFFFSNHWIKDMNLKLSLVKRSTGITLIVKGEVERSETAKQLTTNLEQTIRAFQQSETAACAYRQERERLFGSMLLAKSVVEQAREPFLTGDYISSLRAAHQVTAELSERLLRVKPSQLDKLQQILSQNPPRILLTDRSGRRLRSELNGLARLMAGAQILLEPMLKGQEPAPTDPAVVLKYLVLISLIAERLESGTPNPALGRRPVKATRKPAGAAKSPKGRKPKGIAKKKIVRKTVKAKPTGKARRPVRA